LSKLPTNNYLYQINNNPTITNQINPNTIYKKEYKLERQNKFKQYTANNLEPNDNFNISEFTTIKKIGEGSYGKIFCIKWNKNNKLYAMKKIELHNLEELKEIQNKVKMIKDLYNKTNHYGFIRIFADKVFPLYTFTITYNYYIIMELGERDWEKALQLRMKHQKFYSEYELYQIIFQIVKTLSLMQKNKISHRDIKPQNVLIINGLYKLCDFGEARIIDGSGLIQQRVRGSQLFMSPILFYAYNRNISLVMHNSYKSDVFSLGMCALLAASLSIYALYDIRELFDINAIANIINNRLKNRYSVNLINLIIKMLQIDENLRMDFIALESFLLNFWRN
jgi:serine/threonine protein kinase